MFPHNTEYDYLSKEELLKKTARLFEVVKKEYDKYLENLDKYMFRINAILGTNDFDKVKQLLILLKEKDYLFCCEFSQEFSMLSTMESIIPLEEKLGLPYSVLSMNSIDEVVEVYTKIVFIMRRMEFDYPMEKQLEIIELMDHYKLSPIYLYIVLKTGFFDRKKKIAQQISNLYTCMEQSKWSSLFTSIE